jgi:branched-chain amino acid aminotransferase
MATFSKTWTFHNGTWLEGNPPIMGPRTHAFWLGSSVFDGARYFEGVMPDIDLHAARVTESARKMGINPFMKPEEIVALTRAGVKKFDGKTALYLRPMYWSVGDGPASVDTDPDSADFCLTLWEAPLPEVKGGSLCVSPFRRPTLETMPTDVKTGALYPNNARAVRDALKRGYTNALVLDMLGNVAETATSNIWCVKDGVAFTPIINGTFLNGITRQRTIQLLKQDGVEVVEKVLRVDDILGADEVFTTGNYAKVMPITKVAEREFQPGPMMRRARKLYWDFAKQTGQ